MKRQHLTRKCGEWPVGFAGSQESILTLQLRGRFLWTHSSPCCRDLRRRPLSQGNCLIVLAQLRAAAGRRSDSGRGSLRAVLTAVSVLWQKGCTCSQEGQCACVAHHGNRVLKLLMHTGCKVECLDHIISIISPTPRNVAFKVSLSKWWEMFFFVLYSLSQKGGDLKAISHTVMTLSFLCHK